MVGKGEKSAWAVATELWGTRDNPYEKRAALQEGLAHLQALADSGMMTAWCCWRAQSSG